jgi:ribonuclease HI
MLINFIYSILYERLIHVDLEDGTRLTRLVRNGLPQGSVLSPILYNIYTYDLESSLSNINVLQYADDLLLYKVDSSADYASHCLNASLKLLNKWLDTNGLELSASKSSVVLFSRKRIPPHVNITYDNTSIPVKPNAKFLGVILDSKLSGSLHCDYVVMKCEKILNMMRCLSGVWWGAHPFALKLIYNALIRSRLDYGTFLLQGGNITAFKKLDSIQNKALRIILGAMKSSPVNAMQVECCEPPLYLRRQFLCDNFIFKAYQCSTNPLFSKLKILEEHVRSVKFWAKKPPTCIVTSYRKILNIQAPIYRCPLYPLFLSSFESLSLSPNILLDTGIKKENIESNCLFNYIGEEYWQNTHFIFTDASKISESQDVGVGIFHKQYEIVQKIKLPPEATVFTGECFGVYKAIDYVILMKLKNTVIFTDSKSSLLSINKFPFKLKPSYPIICNIRMKLLECQSLGYSVTLAWIPGHQGIKGNEKADLLAKDAIRCGDIYPYMNYCHDLVSLSRVCLRDSWNILWREGSSLKGKHYYKIQPNINPKPWFSKLDLNRMCISIIIRMRLGHVCTPSHLARLHIVANNCCECGADIGDLNHLFFACSLKDHSSFMNSLIKLRVPFPINITYLLSNPLKYYKSLSLFINDNNIQI